MRTLPLTLSLSASLAALLALAACASPAPAPTTAEPAASAEEGTGHGAIAGAEEVAEPPLGLLSIDEDGAVGLLDLLDGTTSEVGTIGAPAALATDGRYAFATTDDGVEIVDSGRWTWDHGDHFHYYRAEPRVVGVLEGDGAATVATGPLSTAGASGVFFAGSGEAVLLDNAALSDGRIQERFRVPGTPHAGIAAPLGDGAVVTAADDAGRVTHVRYHDASGDPVDGATAACPDARGTITTRAALVIGCADGAVLARMEAGDPVFERVPYPDDAGSPAIAFDARKGRPTVAGVAADGAVWLLDSRESAWRRLPVDSRESAWRRLPVDARVVHAVAVDDEDGHVVLLDAEGRLRVTDGDGRPLSATEPLLDPGDVERATLTVDAQRAYLSAPREGAVHEIDFADDGRIARTLETPTAPRLLAEVGR